MNLLYRRNIMYPQQTYFLWLTEAAMQAILGAFGQTDGTAVINATNEYLSQLAASDRDKATALAGFINEDPMMVCSLGLQPQGVTMPIRWLVGDGVAWIRLDYTKPTSKSIKATIRAKSGYGGTIFSQRYTEGDTSCFFLQFNNNGLYIRTRHGSTFTDQLNYVNGAIYKTITTVSSLIVNGVTYTNGDVATGTSRAPLLLFALGNNGQPLSGSAVCIGNVGCEDDIDLYPFIRQGANGMIDTLTGTFNPNANSSGSFTIEYSLPDGTPWTPSTP